MQEEILKRIYVNQSYLKYLRYHPKWYYYLEQNPNNFILFEKKVKEELKLTTYDKLEKIKKQISFASKFVEYFKK